MSTYRYLGDRLTDPALVGAMCTAVRNDAGKCITRRSAMLVLFHGEQAPRVVLRRLLRKTSAPDLDDRLEARYEDAMANLHVLWQHRGKRLFARVIADFAKW